MRTMILAAVAALGLAAAIAPVASANSNVDGNGQATRMQQTGSYSR